MVMNRNDSYWDHHHTTTRGFDETVNWHLKRAEDRTRCVAASLLLPLRQGHDKTARKTTACLLPWSPTVPLVRRPRKRVETLPMDGCIPVGLRGRLTVVSGDR